MTRPWLDWLDDPTRLEALVIEAVVWHGYSITGADPEMFTDPTARRIVQLAPQLDGDPVTCMAQLDSLGIDARHLFNLWRPSIAEIAQVALGRLEVLHRERLARTHVVAGVDSLRGDPAEAARRLRAAAEVMEGAA